ncbi:hypothetical protein MRX96_033401 [Rhipicephalus microplus]
MTPITVAGRSTRAKRARCADVQWLVRHWRNVRGPVDRVEKSCAYRPTHSYPPPLAAQQGVAKTRAKREHVETFLKWQARSAAQGRDVPLGHWACGSPVAPDCRARVTYVRFRLSAPVARRLALPNLTEQRRPRP